MLTNIKNIRLNKVIFRKNTALDLFEMSLRLWMGYILISNSGVGIITDLKDLGLPDHIYLILKGMWDTGFMMHLVKTVELISGIMLILNFFVPLTLVALIPVLVNIYGMHIFMFNSYITNGLYMLLISLFLTYRHREAFYPLLKVK